MFAIGLETANLDLETSVFDLVTLNLRPEALRLQSLTLRPHDVTMRPKALRFQSLTLRPHALTLRFQSLLTSVTGSNYCTSNQLEMLPFTGMSQFACINWE